MRRREEGDRGRIEDSFSLNAFAKEPVYKFSPARFVCIVLTGGVLGMALCFAVNAILFEISLSRVFAFYFGIMFCCLGSVMLMRSAFQPSFARRAAVFVFSALVLAAGICSLVFRTEWLWQMHVALKILIYTILGVATSFAITFAYLDILSFFHDSSNGAQQDGVKKQGLFESNKQVWLVLLLSVVTGLTYGLTFALQEDGAVTLARERDEALRVDFFVKSLGRSLHFTLPFGLVLGCLGAAVNEYLRYREILDTIQRDHHHTYDKLNVNEV